jgi:allophanate hydrolase subunit 2
MFGPQEDYFTPKGIDTFLSARYNVSGQSDRMGVRLEGAPIENKNGVDIISDGIAYGSVQIPASGTPIIMMADRQTTGGYAKIATVITADLYKIAQAKPGSCIRFQAVTEKEAVAALKEERNFLKQLQYQTYFTR